MTSTGVDEEARTRWGAADAAASSWAVAGLPAPLAELAAAGLLAWLAIQSPKTLSAAARVGFSRERAGVAVRERDRRVDLPKEPVSAMVRRDRVVAAWPSCLAREGQHDLQGAGQDHKGEVG